MKHGKPFLPIALLVLFTGCGESDKNSFSIPSDPNARYSIVDAGGTWARPWVITRRVGPSGESYSHREFDCMKDTFRYLGSGPTFEAMKSSRADKQMSPVIEQSITFYIMGKVCQ